jgi:hypothetical protein
MAEEDLAQIRISVQMYSGHDIQSFRVRAENRPTAAYQFANCHQRFTKISCQLRSGRQRQCQSEAVFIPGFGSITGAPFPASSIYIGVAGRWQPLPEIDLTGRATATAFEH